MKVKIKSVDNASLAPDDNFSVSATLSLLDAAGKEVDTKTVSVSGFRYEAGNLKDSVKGRLVLAKDEWIGQLKAQADLMKELEGLVE